MMAALVLKSPELALEKGEADALAQAISEVEKHYSVSLSPETRAWLGLAGTAAMIYGPRAYMIQKRRRAESKSGKAPSQTPAQVSAPRTEAEQPGGPPTTGGLSASDFGFG